MNRRRSLMTGSLLVFASIVAACAAPDTITADPNDAGPLTTLNELTTTTTTLGTTTTTTLGTTTTTEPERRPLVVSGTGDVNLDPSFVRTFPSTGYEDAWTGLFDAFIDDDVTIVNLECAPSLLGEPWDKPWLFRCDPAALPSMAAAGVEVASLANNHSMDFGMDAMLDGRTNLLAAGIAPVGAGANRAEAYEPAFIDVDGWTVAVIGSGGVNPETGTWIATDERPGMTSGDDTDSIAEAVRAADAQADIVIVTAHWGKERETSVGFERRQAEAWIEAGADGIFGHHQHLLLPLEMVDGKPVAFGLSNFVWQAYPPESKRTAIAQYVFDPDGSVTACLVDVIIERHGHPVVQDPTQLGCANSEFKTP